MRKIFSMNRVSIVVLIFILSLNSFGQITMETNLPKVLPLNSQLTFEVRIKKGALTNFSKYQMEVSGDIVIESVDSQSGSFAFDANVLKIIWVMTPIEPVITIKLKLNSGVIKDKINLVQKYFYIENDSKRQVEMEGITISVIDSASLQASTVAFYTINPKMPPSIITTTINVDEISTKRPELLIQQVTQLRKDAKDAKEVGEREKKEAELKIYTANESITTATAIRSDEERRIALEKANADKKKAEKDLEIAERVLLLAKSLEENANEIEKINKSVNPGSFNGQTTSVASGNQAQNSNKLDSKETSVNIDDLDKVFGPPTGGKKDKSKKDPDSNSETESGIVYKIQLGAFSKKPAKSDFKSVGKIKIIEEDGMYKVLYGSFNIKEDAIKERLAILTKGFDGFVVTYQDGSRQK